MMGHLVDFVGYLCFSSFDFFALYVLACSMFNVHPSSYKLQIIKIVSLSTIISYLLVIINAYDYIPSIIVTPLILFIMLRAFIVSKIDRINKKSLYSIFVSISGTIAYGVVQLILAKLLVHYNFLNMDDLNSSFSIRTYITQSMSAIIGCLISGYLLHFRGGFGFIFKSGNYKLSTSILVLMILILGILFQIFNIENSTSFMFMLVISVLCISALIAYYLSYKQDNIEYQ